LWGLSASANLPGHVAERQWRRAEELLREPGFVARFQVVRDSPGGGKEDREATMRGTGSTLLLVAECDGLAAGFSALGERGKPAERVAEEAVEDFLHWWRSGAAVEMHLADQLLLPLALADGPSSFTTCRITQHLLTNAWVIQQFLPVRIEVQGQEGEAGSVCVRPG